jgi:hypothetical protein
VALQQDFRENNLLTGSVKPCLRVRVEWRIHIPWCTSVLIHTCSTAQINWTKGALILIHFRNSQIINARTSNKSMLIYFVSRKKHAWYMYILQITCLFNNNNQLL